MIFKKLNYTTWSSIVFAIFILTKRERPPIVIFQLDVGHNWPNKLPQKSMDEKSSPFVTHTSPLSFIIHKMAPSAFKGYVIINDIF
jgi:hypothetical protein